MPIDLIKKIKAQLKTTVPKDYDLEFDICMKCGRRLEDKKYSTLKKHQKEFHPIKRKLKAREIFFKYPTTSVLSILIISLVVITLVGDNLLEPFFIMLGITIEKQIDPEQCGEDVKALKQELFTRKNFDSSNAEEFNRLLNECNVNFFAVIREVPIFEQDIYKQEE